MIRRDEFSRAKSVRHRARSGSAPQNLERPSRCGRVVGVIEPGVVEKGVERGSIDQEEKGLYSDASVGASQRCGRPCEPPSLEEVSCGSDSRKREGKNSWSLSGVVLGLGIR